MTAVALLLLLRSCLPSLFPSAQTVVTLVATGTTLSVDPDRVIVKKIILSGIPVKVKNRYAVVKHMFYSADDVKVRVSRCRRLPIERGHVTVCCCGWLV